VPGVALVIRGEDLLASTGRQIHLGRMLGRPEPPVFLHHPVLRKPSGDKLSKASHDTGTRELRADGGNASAPRRSRVSAGANSNVQSGPRGQPVPALYLKEVPPIKCLLDKTVSNAILEWPVHPRAAGTPELCTMPHPGTPPTGPPGPAPASRTAWGLCPSLLPSSSPAKGVA